MAQQILMNIYKILKTHKRSSRINFTGFLVESTTLTRCFPALKSVTLMWILLNISHGSNYQWNLPSEALGKSSWLTHTWQGEVEGAGAFFLNLKQLPQLKKTFQRGKFCWGPNFKPSTTEPLWPSQRFNKASCYNNCGEESWDLV